MELAGANNRGRVAGKAEGPRRGCSRLPAKHAPIGPARQTVQHANGLAPRLSTPVLLSLPAARRRSTPAEHPGGSPRSYHPGPGPGLITPAEHPRHPRQPQAPQARPRDPGTPSGTPGGTTGHQAPQGPLEEVFG
jgi:hypothetical protein